MSEAQYANLTPGDPAPCFRQRSYSNPAYAFDTAAGRYLVLCFFGSAADAHARAAIDAADARPDLFNDAHASFFGVSNDPADETEKRVRDAIPGHRFFWDFDGVVGRAYGALPLDSATAGSSLQLRRFWIALDPTLRVLRVIPFRPDGSDVSAVTGYLETLPPPARFAGIELQAPILFLPNVFEPEFCARLIALYEANGGTESGFMREAGGKTVGMHDYSHKRRKDYLITDQDVIRDAQARVLRRIVPEIRKVHQFNVTRMERYIVACYAAEDAAHFRQHRDNTTKGTAHRRFATSILLSNDYEGGDICFPEYGPRGFRPPAGGAVVFSCSLLHAVSKVTCGRRYAFLPFLYDEAAAKLREENNPYLGDGVGGYRAS